MPALHEGAAPWRNLVVEGDNWDTYKDLAWTVREGGAWANARFDRDLDHIYTQGRFDVNALAYAR